MVMQRAGQTSSSRIPKMEIQVQILSLAPLTRLEKFLIAGSNPAHTANVNQALVDKGPLAQERAAP